MTKLQISIKNLRLRAIIGIEEWEREKKQDIVINITMSVDEEKSVHSDDINDSANYKKITKNIIKHVENSRYYLVEKLAGKIADIAKENGLVKEVEVEVEKPHALRFADSVSVTVKK